MTRSDNILINHRTIWRLALPMILANISVPVLGLVDTAVMGHLASADYLASVALGSLIFTFIFWGFGFLRMATTGLTAQASGKQDTNLTLGVIQQGVMFAIAIALLLLLLQTPIKQFAFSMLDSTPSVIDHAKNYFDIRIWSSPAILINYVILGWLIGTEKTKKALYLVLIVNISNMLFDLLFVNALEMTVEGVALASVIAEYLGLLTGLTFLKSEFLALRSLIPGYADIKGLTNKKWLTLNSNIFIRTLCLMFSFAFFTAQGAKQGQIILAANALLLNFITFMAFVLDGFSNAIEIISGQAMGANDRTLLRRGFLLASLWAMILASLFSLGYYLFGTHIISSLTSIPHVISTANEYLTWLIFIPIIAVWSYLLDGLFIGTTRSKEMRNTMLFSSLCCYLPVWYSTQFLANHGLWLALLIFLAARGITQAFYLPKILIMK
ncbi:MAG: MATE family efflux transporter [Gammaproteobacteria bacterium]|nr:MATE family efflux transporter [Gammaproteobacteria bacterium]